MLKYLIEAYDNSKPVWDTLDALMEEHCESVGVVLHKDLPIKKLTIFDSNKSCIVYEWINPKEK